MSWTIAGIDEAGYGPMLGPLCVGMSVLRIRDADEAAAPPDLWELLRAGVCREPGRGGRHDAKGRIAVADSKALKLPNDCKSAHPLIHLERGVLGFARVLWGEAITSDRDLLRRLIGAEPDAKETVPGLHRCYGGAPAPLPLSLSAGEVGIAANQLRGALDSAGIGIIDLRLIVVAEGDYNTIIRETGNKAETTVWALGKHLRRVWEKHAAGRLGIVCDRLGGRAAYADMLARELPGASIETIEEGPARSRYLAAAGQKRAGIAFLTEGEKAHLPVALASMIAKLGRELLMRRFNAYWGERFRDLNGRDIRPTAGYATDARRWLDEIGADVLGQVDRAALMRVA